MTARRRTISPGIASGGVIALLLGALIAAPAQADPLDSPQAPSTSEFCAGQPMALVADLVEGQPVTWKTTVKGTDPSIFTGEYIGRISAGLGYGPDGRPRDLLLVKLEGPEVEGTAGALPAGVWAGASGSPVYDENGALIGAVSYGFSSEAEPVAGVTPAEVMQGIGELPGTVPLDGPAAAAVSESVGDVPTGAGLQQLTPVRITTGGSAAALDGRSKRLTNGVPGFRGMTPAGMPIAGGASSGADLPIVPGGNIAVSYGYGAVSAMSVGTVTAVCGTQVYAYGHPNMWDSTLVASFHGASTARIVPSGGRSYKEITEVGARKGVITDDRLAGIRGTLGQFPETVEVITRTRVGTNPTRAVTHVSEKWLVAPAAATQLNADALRLLDNQAVGSAKVSWKLTYRRANGEVKTIQNVNRYADLEYFSEVVAEDLAGDIAALQANPFETVTVTKVDVSANFAHGYNASRITGLQMKVGGKWKSLKKNAVVQASRGKTYEFRAVLSPAPNATNGTEYLPFKATVPKSARKNFVVRVDGADAGGFDDFDLWIDETFSAKSFEQLVKQIDANDRSDAVGISTKHWAKSNGAVVRSKRTEYAPQVLFGGSHQVKLQVPEEKKAKKR